MGGFNPQNDLTPMVKLLGTFVVDSTFFHF